MLLTIKDVAQRLRCSDDTVARLRAANLLHDVRIGRSVRITSKSLEEYIAGLTGDGLVTPIQHETSAEDLLVSVALGQAQTGRAT